MRKSVTYITNIFECSAPSWRRNDYGGEDGMIGSDVLWRDVSGTDVMVGRQDRLRGSGVELVFCRRRRFRRFKFLPYDQECVAILPKTSVVGFLSFLWLVGIRTTENNDRSGWRS